MFGDEKANLELRKLGLDSILNLGLGERRIALRNVEDVDSSHKATASKGLPKAKSKAPPRRTRRHGKEEAEPVADEPDQDIPIASIETAHQSTNIASVDSASKRRGSGGSVTSKVKAGVTSAVNAVQGGFRSLRSRSRALEKSSAASPDHQVGQSPAPEPTTEAAHIARRSTRTRSFTPNYSLHRSRKPSSAHDERDPVNAGGGETVPPAVAATSGINGQDTSATEAVVETQADASLQTDEVGQNALASTDNLVPQDHVITDEPNLEPNTVASLDEPRVEEHHEDIENSNRLIEVEPTQDIQTGNSLPENATLAEDPSSEEIATGEAQPILDAPSETPQTLERPTNEGDDLERKSSPQTPRKRAAPKFFDSQIEKPRPQRRGPGRKPRVREAIYISQEEEQHQAKRTEGLPGIYIDRFKSKKRERESTKLRPDSFVLVFKSSKLRDPEWLEKNKGTGIGAIASAIAAAIISKEDNTRPLTGNSADPEPQNSEEGEENELGATTAQDSQESGQVTQHRDQLNGLEEGEVGVDIQSSTATGVEKMKRDDGEDASTASQPNPKRRKSNPENNGNPTVTSEGNNQAQIVVPDVQVQPLAEQPSPQTPQPPTKRKYTKKRPSDAVTDPQGPATKKRRKEAASTQLESSSNGSSVPVQQHPAGPQITTPTGPTNLQGVLQPPFQPTFYAHGSTASFSNGHTSASSAVYHGPGSQFQAQASGTSPYFSPYYNTPRVPSMLSAVPQHFQEQVYRSPYQSPYSNPSLHQSPVSNEPSRHGLPLGAASQIGQPSAGHPAIPVTSQQQAALPQQTYRSPYATNTLSTPVQPSQPNVNLLDSANVPFAPTPEADTSGLLLYYQQQAASTKRKTSESETTSESVAYDPKQTEAGTPTASQPFSVAPPPTIKKARNRTAGPVGEKHQTKAQKAAAKKAKIEADLLAAEAVDFPEGVIRLAAIYKESLGNLLLSADKSSLEFVGINQHPPELPILVLSMTKMDLNPITSVRGSYPMQLRLTFREKRWGKIFSFQFSSTKEGFESASSMRAKLIAAQITAQVTSAPLVSNANPDVGGRVPGQPFVKPYKCDKCEARFLNDVGLKYHVTKSQTTCNPNWDPAIHQDRRRKNGATPRKPKPTPRKPAPETSSSSSESSESEEDDGRNDVEMADVEVDDAEGVDVAMENYEAEFQNDEERETASGDSDDSIFEWAKTVATNGPGPRTNRRTSVQPSTPTRSKRALEYQETEFLPSDSDDSIFEWAKTVATDGLDSRKSTGAQSSTPTRSKRGNGYRRLRGEAELLKEIIEALKQAGHRTSHMVVPTPRVAQSLAPLGDQHRFKRIILSLVEDNGGAFPGDKSLWYAVVAVWFKTPFKSGTLPEFKFCTQAVDQLLDEDMLQTVEFNFSVEGRQARSSWNTWRRILVTPNTGSKSSQVKKIQNLILESYPDYYVPSQFAPPEPWLSKLTALVALQGNPIRRRPTRVRDEDEQEDSEENEELRPRLRRNYSDLRVDESSESSSEPGSERDVGFDDYAEEDGEVGPDFGDDEDEDDDLSRLSRRRSRSMTTSEQTEGDHSRRTIRQKPSQLVSSLSRRTRRRVESPPSAEWATAPTFLPDPETGAWAHAKIKLPSQPPKRVRIGLPQEEKDRRAQLAYTRLHAWDLIPAVIQNSRTGAWDQKVAKVRRYDRRTRLPEPITFLQDQSGAWSHRAFGHGVNPIFSRPSRRADGNPHLTAYTSRLESGFRPVVTPKNGMLFPAAPSKKLLRQLAAASPAPVGNSEVQESIEPKDSSRKRRAAKKRVSLAEAPAGPRISKITGRPVQKYVRREPHQRRGSTRRGSTLSMVESVDDHSGLTPEPENVRRSGRAVRKTVHSLDEVELLNFYPPPAAEPEVRMSQNPGLKTLPTSFWSNDSLFSGIEVQNFVTEYKNLQFQDTKFVSDGCDMTEGSWVYNGSQTGSPDQLGHDFKVRWSDDTAFTVEDLPYKELDLVGQETRPVEACTPRRKRQRRDSVLPAEQTTEQISFDTSRPLTALSEDFQHVLEDPREAPSVFGVEVVDKPFLTRTRRGKKSKAVSNAFEIRLLVAVVVIRTLTGGLEASIDWIIISGLFPDYSITFITLQWRQIQKKCVEQTEKLVTDFQEAFLAAYQKGEVAPIDFDKLMEYNWDKLIDWVINTIKPSLGSTSLTLPSSRESLETNYDIQEQDSDPDNWRDVYFASSGPSIYKRIGAATSIPNAFPLTSPHHQPSVNDFTIAKSWVRAVALTPEVDWTHSSALAREKLTSLGLDLTKRALSSLTTSKTIHHRAKGRASPGRSYEATDAFLAPLRKDIKNDTYVQAREYKKYLDAMFASGHERVRVDYLADEGTIMCITSLQAGRRIKLEGIDVPMSKFGLCGDGLYEMRRVDREKFRWEIDIVPTPSYTHDAFLPQFDITPPGIGPQGEIPVWLGIGGTVIWDLWRKILPAVAQVVALRSGVTLKGLAREFRPTLEEWELGVLMEWGVQRGMFERVSERVEGWTVGEWWWVFVGRVL